MMDIGPIIIEKKHLLAKDLIDRKVAELNSIIEKLGLVETELSQKDYRSAKNSWNTITR